MRKKILIVVLFFIVGGAGWASYTHFTKTAISVVMSTYNRADFLPRSIESILNQTFPDFEFIIINDGSTDNSADILKQYAKKDSRIRIITNEQNKGLVYSLNKGLDEARGKYIARMDDDDLSLPTRFAVQLKFMEDNPNITVVGGPRNVLLDQNAAFQRQKNQQYIKAAETPYKIGKYDVSDAAITSYFDVPIFHPSAFIRADFLKRHKIKYSERYKSAEDIYFWFSIIQNGGKIIQLPHPLVIRGLSEKKGQYYEEQIASYNRFLKHSISDIFNLPESPRWLSEQEFCQILNGLEAYIDKKPFITLDALNHLKETRGCLKQQ